MTYDVPVKLFSFHLVLMSLVVLAPDVRRVCQAIFYHSGEMARGHRAGGVRRLSRRGHRAR
jgi:hypothetical protein